jgi:hypothetical protein
MPRSKRNCKGQKTAIRNRAKTKGIVTEAAIFNAPTTSTTVITASRRFMI